jgi:hypothetical protein
VDSETDTWLDISMGCGHLSAEQHKKSAEQCSLIGNILGKMINNPDPFIIQPES